MARDRYEDRDTRSRSGRGRPNNGHDDFAEYDDYDDRRPRDDSAEYDAYDSGYTDAYEDETGASRAMVARGDEQSLAPVHDETGHNPVVIPGTGVSMGMPFIKRRSRPLTMRLAILTVVATLLITGMMSVTPLGASAQPGVSSFEALAGAVVMTRTQQFVWYTAKWGDSLLSLSKKYGVQIGGIMELNKLCPGQELQIGTPYKIPLSSSYGMNYQQEAAASGYCNFLPSGGVWGATVFGSNWWNARAGNPGPEAICSSAHGSYLGFGFVSPNPHSYWVRGYSWYHDGVDLAAPSGNPIHAVQAGQIIWAGYDGTNGFGWSVVINHCFHVSTLYGHMLGLAPGISIGQNVDQNTVIGYEGSTGWSTGPHLHISVMVDNSTVDPMMFYSSIYAITH
ncbi:MAG TPA: LysM peptidoglycan-binding domain-containing M23 family metallopeptidase [Ktedonobacterales bacterium]